MSVPSLVKLAPNMDMNTLVNALNTNFNQIQAESRRKVVTDENGVDRIVIGKLESGDYGIEVSDTGYDVDTASDDQKVMSSQWMMWKIINSGQTGTVASSSYRRSGTLSITSVNVGYVSDIIIPIENLDKFVGYGQTFTARLQVFVRDYSSKQDMNQGVAGIYRDSSGNWGVVIHKYWIIPNTNYLVLRTIFRWMSGTITITPRNQFVFSVNYYWEIANPTRSMPAGGGGSGPTTSNIVYYDACKYTPETNTWGTIYSASIQVPDTASYNTFTVGWEPSPAISFV